MIASNDYLRSVTAEWGYGKTEAPSGAESLPRKRGGTGDYKGAALIVIINVNVFIPLMIHLMEA
jgi:hypothetical protein